MAARAFLLIASFLLVLFILARPLGTLLAKMIVGASLHGVSTLETGLWRMMGIDSREMGWFQYLMAILWLNIFGLVLLFVMLMLQGILPLTRNSSLACHGIWR